MPGDKRLTIEIKTNSEKKTVRYFKARCIEVGSNMREQLMKMMQKYLRDTQRKK